MDDVGEPEYYCNTHDVLIGDISINYEAIRSCNAPVAGRFRQFVGLRGPALDELSKRIVAVFFVEQM